MGQEIVYRYDKGFATRNNLQVGYNEMIVVFIERTRALRNILFEDRSSVAFGSRSSEEVIPIRRSIFPPCGLLCIPSVMKDIAGQLLLQSIDGRIGHFGLKLKGAVSGGRSMFGLEHKSVYSTA